MERFSVDGIVIKTSVTGESDAILHILTRERGLIRAFAKGARSAKSKLHSASSQFCYGTWTFFENKGVYTVSEASITEVFFALRNDLTRLSLAQYFCEVSLKCIGENIDSAEYLRLILNCLSFLCSGKKPDMLIKVVFELRFACISGYAPNLVACDECGKFESPVMYFDCLNGNLYCDSCGKDRACPTLSFSAVTVMRHIVFSEFRNIFSFTADDETLKAVSKLTALYLKNCTQQNFKTLQYLLSIE
jgi:DNA repair protein RecO (recombination protein O)